MNVVEDVVGIDPKVCDLVVVHLSGHVGGAVQDAHLEELGHDDDNDEDGDIGGALMSLVMMIRIMKMVMLVALSKKFTLTSLVSKNLGILKAKASRRAGRTYMTKWSLKEFFTFALLYCKGRLMAKHLVMVMVKQLNSSGL